jgi:hypothetical protein
MTVESSLLVRHLFRFIAALLPATLVLLVACGDDDATNDSRSEREPATDSSAATTEPPASDSEAAFPIVEDLVLEATRLVDELYQEPEAVNDPDNADVERLREIYTEDSPTPDAVTEQLHELVDNGERMRAADSGVFRDLGVYEMAAVDEDTVRFRICASEDRETIDANGNVVDQRAQVTQGTGEARRIDGIWRFYGIHPEEDRTLPIEPGTANAGFCDRLFDEQGDAS